MLRLIATALALTVIGSALPGHAASKSAKRLVQQTIEEACGGKGDIEPAGIVERDLTGDGKADLLINYGSITCHEGINGFCGSGGCSIDVYVSRNGKLGQKQDMFGADMEIIDGKPALIKIYDRDGASHTYRWKDGRFN